MKASSKIVWGSVVVVCGAWACGGTAYECPPGYECKPICSDGPFGNASAGDCVPPDAGAYDSGSGGYDANAPFDAGGGGGGGVGGYPAGSNPPSSASSTALAFDVVDAEQSTALHRVVMVSDSPSNALVILDPVSHAMQTVALPSKPVAVGVDPSGLHAAVAYDAHVSEIDLQTATLTTTCNLGSDAADIALSDDGVAYVAPLTDQWVSLRAVTLSTCTDSSQNGGLYADSRLQLHPSGLAAFVADRGLSPSSIDRCYLNDGGVGCNDANSTDEWGRYEFCGSLWINSTGARIYTGCGVTLAVPPAVVDGFLTYSGKLTVPGAIQHLTEVTAASRVLAIPAVPAYATDPSLTLADTEVRVYGTQYLDLQKQVQIPLMTGGAPAHGRFVFGSDDGSTLYVIASSSMTIPGGTYELETLVP